MQTTFSGFTPDTFQFLMEIGFHNSKEFFEANRARYEAAVKRPMQLLATTLLPAALCIEPQFDQRIPYLVSRIRRDTRFTRDKSLYRDHAWIGFRIPGQRISEGMGLYFEITPDSYGYGMGMYCPDTARMKQYRAVMCAKPDQFLTLAEKLERYGFLLEGERFKRDRYPMEPPGLKEFLNLKNISWTFSSAALSKTLAPALADELKTAFGMLGPMYLLLNPPGEGADG